jgi:hypothetical protein
MSQPITLLALAAGVLGVAGFMYLEKMSKHVAETQAAVKRMAEP